MRLPLARVLRALLSLQGSAFSVALSEFSLGRSARSNRERGEVRGAPGCRVVCRVERLEPRRLLSTYYVSPGGSDGASGRSIASAWRSIDRVNQQDLKAGDMVLFQGGKSFNGSLYVPSKEGGTDRKPVVFSTFGKGRATIRSGTRPGIDIAQTGGVAITNLNFVGDKKGKSAGIYLHLDWSNVKASYFHVRNVDVTGYGREGILIGTWGKGSSLKNVKIQNATLHDNVYGGLKATGSAHNSNKNWVIERVRAFNNPGSRSASHVTGSGIYLADVEDAFVQYSIAYNNGKDGNAPVGIWAAGSNRVVFQYNESYGNKTRAISDGGGFDFDWDVHNSVMQYNYSHDNDGPGFLLYPGKTAGGGNVIRYNVSENDGRKNGKGGIQIGGNVTYTDIYNNVVYMKATGNSQSAAFIAHDFGANGKVPKHVSIRNNIFQTTGGVKVVSLSNNVADKSNLQFNANAYYSTGADFKIQWGPKLFKSLSSWRNEKGQEKWKGVATGFQGDPRLRAPGHGGTIGDPDKLRTLRAYTLARSSPIINKGVPRLSFLHANPKVAPDFFGRKGLRGGKFEMGVEEVR